MHINLHILFKKFLDYDNDFVNLSELTHVA